MKHITIICLVTCALWSCVYAGNTCSSTTVVKNPISAPLSPELAATIAQGIARLEQQIKSDAASKPADVEHSTSRSHSKSKSYNPALTVDTEAPVRISPSSKNTSQVPSQLQAKSMVKKMQGHKEESPQSAPAKTAPQEQPKALFRERLAAAQAQRGKQPKHETKGALPKLEVDG